MKWSDILLKNVVGEQVFIQTSKRTKHNKFKSMKEKPIKIKRNGNKSSNIFFKQKMLYILYF